MFRHNLGRVRDEFRFTWPTKESFQEKDRVVFVFRRLPMGRERELTSKGFRLVTDERTHKTIRESDQTAMHAILAEALTSVENIEVTQEDGDPAPACPPDTRGKLSRLQNFFTSNLGLDVKEFGSLELDMQDWAYVYLMRQPPEEDEKLKNSETPLSDGSAEKKEKAPEAVSTPHTVET